VDIPFIGGNYHGNSIEVQTEGKGASLSHRVYLVRTWFLAYMGVIMDDESEIGLLHLAIWSVFFGIITIVVGICMLSLPVIGGGIGLYVGGRYLVPLLF
jgi:hypothetical protein